MPYTLDGNCVKKKDTGETVKCHKNHADAVNHLQALEANVKDSAIARFSMSITKARFDPNEVNPNRQMQWRSVNSDVDSDLYDEQMSTELFYDFTHRINDNIPLPDAFEEVICEGDWCGGMPYLSVAHYKSGTGLMNVPGMVQSVYVEGDKLKSRGFLNNTPMGHAVFESLKQDLVEKRSGNQEHQPVRISIGFLDLEHKHVAREGGQEFVFTRSEVGQVCPLCMDKVGGKIYTKGQLIHLALTRVPVNPRTEMVAEMEEKSMDITTKKQDAESIIGGLVEELEEKSTVSDTSNLLVIKADEGGKEPTPDMEEIAKCYDENTGGWDNACIAQVMNKYMPAIRDSIGVPAKSQVPKGILDEVVSIMYKSSGYEVPVVEEAMNEKPDEKVVEKAVEAPVEKADMKHEDMETPEEEKKEEAKEKSAIEKAFAELQTAIQSKDVNAVNKAFTTLGTSVEKEFAPEPEKLDAGNMEQIIRSVMEEMLTPVRADIAVLKAAQGQPQNNTVSNGVVQSKALKLGGMGRPEDMVMRSGQPQQPTKKLSQIEQLARRSTGLQS